MFYFYLFLVHAINLSYTFTAFRCRKVRLLSVFVGALIAEV